MALLKASVTADEIMFPFDVDLNNIYFRVDQITTARNVVSTTTENIVTLEDGDQHTEYSTQKSIVWMYDVVCTVFQSDRVEIDSPSIAQTVHSFTEEQIYSYDGENIRQRAYNAVKATDPMFADAQDV